MAGTLPPMMQVMKDIGGIEIPESLARLAGEPDKPEAGKAKAQENGEAKSEAAGPSKQG